MKSKITIVLLWVTITACNCQNLNTYLPGTWKVEGKETYEKWELKSESLIEGYGFKKSEKGELVTEKLRLIKDGQCWNYEAIVGNQNDGKPVTFKQNCEIEEKWIFENSGHDFPKKIIYTPLTDSKMFVEVLGDEDKGFSFYMNRIK